MWRNLRDSSRLCMAILLLVLLVLVAGCNLSRVPTVEPTQPFIIPTLTIPPTFTVPPTPNATPTPTTSPEIVLFLGDSITEGWRVNNLYPAAFNGGHWGDTSAQTLARYQNRFTGFYYDAAVVLTGINDITGGVQESVTQDNIAQLTAQLEGATEKIVLGALLPVGVNNYGPQVTQRIIALNAWMRDHAAARGYLYADYYSALSTPDGYAAPGMLQDGLHPSRTGYETMAAVLAQTLSG
jgi:lysophospholipase L1-like esterase